MTTQRTLARLRRLEDESSGAGAGRCITIYAETEAQRQAAYEQVLRQTGQPVTANDLVVCLRQLGPAAKAGLHMIVPMVGSSRTGGRVDFRTVYEPRPAA